MSEWSRSDERRPATATTPQLPTQGFGATPSSSDPRLVSHCSVFNICVLRRSGEVANVLATSRTVTAHVPGPVLELLPGQPGAMLSAALALHLFARPDGQRVSRRRCLAGVVPLSGTCPRPQV